MYDLRAGLYWRSNRCGASHMRDMIPDARNTVKYSDVPPRRARIGPQDPRCMCQRETGTLTHRSPPDLSISSDRRPRALDRSNCRAPSRPPDMDVATWGLSHHTGRRNVHKVTVASPMAPAQTPIVRSVSISFAAKAVNVEFVNVEARTEAT